MLKSLNSTPRDRRGERPVNDGLAREALEVFPVLAGSMTRDAGPAVGDCFFVDAHAAQVSGLAASRVITWRSSFRSSQANCPRHLSWRYHTSLIAYRPRRWRDVEFRHSAISPSELLDR